MPLGGMKCKTKTAFFCFLLHDDSHQSNSTQLFFNYFKLLHLASSIVVIVVVDVFFLTCSHLRLFLSIDSMSVFSIHGMCGGEHPQRVSRIKHEGRKRMKEWTKKKKKEKHSAAVAVDDVPWCGCDNDNRQFCASLHSLCLSVGALTHLSMCSLCCNLFIYAYTIHIHTSNNLTQSRTRALGSTFWKRFLPCRQALSSRPFTHIYGRH